jgi:hypothetical protein
MVFGGRRASSDKTKLATLERALEDARAAFAAGSLQETGSTAAEECETALFIACTRREQVTNPQGIPSNRKQLWSLPREVSPTMNSAREHCGIPNLNSNPLVLPDRVMTQYGQTRHKGVMF